MRLRIPRLGRPFWLIWLATTASSLGDGVRMVAFPLIAASITRDPSAVAVVSMAGFLPWLLFGLVGGAVVDRTDRRGLMWRTDLVRAALVGGFAALVAAGSVAIATLAVVSFLLGVAEIFFDNAASAIVPMLVEDSRIEQANSWIFSTQNVMATLLGAPIGGALYAVGRAVPLVTDAASFLLSAILVAAVAGEFRARSAEAAPTTIRQDIADGLRWLFTHRLLRVLALLLAVLNATFAAAEAVLVLYALEVLHLSTVGYGLLLTLIAVGGLVGTALAPTLLRRLGLRPMLVGVGLVQGVMLVGVGVSSSLVMAVAAMLLVGGTSMAWNVVTVSLRQRVVPAALLGRVTSSYRVIGFGAMPLGALLGGGLARTYGLHSPYLVSGVVLLTATLGCLPFITEPVPAVQPSRP
ncbi:MAG TPA: MFS transporter [Jatrophihabitans sp.]|nr:MFS transporter [Jatrophihabitans sp.]